jgi:hypothetical protein
VEELRLQAGTRNASGHPAQGARLVDRALGLLEQHRESSHEWLHARARLLITRAFCEFEVHGLDRGKTALAAAIDAAKACDSPDVDALVHA